MFKTQKDIYIAKLKKNIDQRSHNKMELHYLENFNPDHSHNKKKKEKKNRNFTQILQKWKQLQYRLTS